MKKKILILTGQWFTASDHCPVSQIEPVQSQYRVLWRYPKTDIFIGYSVSKIDTGVKNGDSVEYVLDEPANIKAVHIVFNSDLDRTTLPGGYCERTHATRCNILLDSPTFYMPKTLCKEFELSITFDDNTTDKKVITDNMKRAYHFEINKSVKKISLTPLDVSIVDFIDEINSYINWYNTKRIKQSLGYMSPVEYRHSLGLIA